MSNTALRQVGLKRNYLPIIIGLAIAIVGLAAAAWFSFKNPPPAPLVEVPKPPPVVAVRDAAVELPPVTPDAGPARVEVDAGSVPEPVDAGVVVAPVGIRTGKLVFRIRPYAEIFVDEKKLGETPLPPETVTLGKHRVRLSNPTFGKDVVIDVVVKPGENLIKHNFKE
jgi:hypothetical protein